VIELLLSNFKEFDYAELPGPLFNIFEETYLRAMDLSHLDVVQFESEWSHEIVRCLAETSDAGSGVDVRQSAINLLGALELVDRQASDALFEVIATAHPFLVAPVALEVVEAILPNEYQRAWEAYCARSDADASIVALRTT